MSVPSVLHVHPTIGIGVESYLVRLTRGQIRQGQRVGLLSAGAP